jgi:hypothetical protein
VVLRCNSDKYPSTFLWSRQHGVFQPDQNLTSVSGEKQEFPELRLQFELFS